MKDWGKKKMQPTLHLSFNHLFFILFLYLGLNNVAGILPVEDTKVRSIVFVNRQF